MRIGAGEKTEFELIRRDQVCRWHDAISNQRLHLGRDKAARRCTAEHRVAGVNGLGVACFHERHGVENCVADVIASLIAAEHELHVVETAAGIDAAHHVAHIVAGEQRTAPLAITGVVREHHGIDRHDLVADALQREYRGRVADVTVRDRALNRKNPHRPIISPAVRNEPKARGARCKTVHRIG